MPKFQMQIDVDHGILFLSDAVPNFAIPDDTGSSFVTFTSNCIVFRVMHYVDGATEVTIADRDCERDDGSKLWSGGVSITSGVITLSNSGAFHYLNVPTPAGYVEINIWADDDSNPEWIWIKLASIGQK